MTRLTSPSSDPVRHLVLLDRLNIAKIKEVKTEA